MFIVVRVSNNNTIVLFCSVWLCANEVKAAWFRIFQFLKTNFPQLAAKATTIISDRDKDISKDMAVTFDNDDGPQQLCRSRHRRTNLSRYGKSTKEEFASLLQENPPTTTDKLSNPVSSQASTEQKRLR